MFKNALLFRIGSDWQAPPVMALQDALEGDAFAPCTPTQELSTGWIPPRGEEGSGLVESIGGQLIMKLFIEKKSVPGSAIKHELEERCKRIEAERGRAPGRKEKKELKEEIRFELLPRAFSKRSQCIVWIDTKNQLLVIGTGSKSVADLVITQLVDTLAGASSVIALKPLNTAMSPSAAMAMWLQTMEAPYNFSIDRDCELKQMDNEQSVVRYARHNLEIAEIAEHIKSGKVPTKLAMTWNNKVSFVLTDKFQVSKLEFIDVLLGEGEEGGFDTDAAIATGGLTEMLPDLIDALGGELEDGAANGEAQEETEAAAA
jgi:recombination associated protein RdgC